MSGVYNCYSDIIINLTLLNEIELTVSKKVVN